MDKEYKSYAKIYWIIYLILMAVFFLGDIFKMIPLTLIYPFAICFIIIIIGQVDLVRVRSYLKKNHYAKWKEITTSYSGYLGFGFFAQWSLIKFFFSNDTLNDMNIQRLKNESRLIIILSIVHFIFIIVFIEVVFALKFKDFIILDWFKRLSNS